MANWLLLDRDGTICERHHYLTRPEQVRLLEGVGESLRIAGSHGLRFAVITNQSAVARGLMTRSDLDKVHDKLAGLLKAYGVELAGVYSCLHHPNDGCQCRKPGTGLFERFSREMGVKPQQCVMIGDAPSDILAGRSWGCQTVAILGEFFPESSHPHPAAGTPAEAILVASQLLRRTL